MLPDYFFSPTHLPFNAAALREKFRPAAPDTDPGGDGCCLLLRGTDLLLDAAGHLPRQATVELATQAPLYIGDWQGVPCRIGILGSGAELPAGLVAESLLAAEPRLPIDLLSLGGTAGQIAYWEQTSRFCSRCGGENGRLAGGWGKKCIACGHEHFPHIHPCAIVLVRRPGEVLLTRKAAWPAGRYGLVAGFLDFGECLEETVVREVAEETGVRVDNIRYIGSQAWPFPSQLMAGFVADYAGGEVQVDKKELEDARWFPVDALPALPPRRSIARYILDHCLQAE
jgi:NAD+ diphosphatase